MLQLKTNPAGVDVYIQAFQKFLYKKLKDVWPVDDVSLEGYGRCYRNSNDKGYVPEVFVNATTPNNTSYKQIVFEKDKHKAVFFFDVDDISSYKSEKAMEMNRVSIIFITNIAKLKPGISWRGDEEVSNDVQRIMTMRARNLIMTGSATGFKNVFKSFNGLVNKDGEVFEDRHPLFCFSFQTELYFNPTLVDCS